MGLQDAIQRAIDRENKRIDDGQKYTERHERYIQWYTEYLYNQVTDQIATDIVGKKRNASFVTIHLPQRLYLKESVEREITIVDDDSHNRYALDLWHVEKECNNHEFRIRFCLDRIWYQVMSKLQTLASGDKVYISDIRCVFKIKNCYRREAETYTTLPEHFSEYYDDLYDSFWNDNCQMQLTFRYPANRTVDLLSDDAGGIMRLVKADVDRKSGNNGRIEIKPVGHYSKQVYVKAEEEVRGLVFLQTDRRYGFIPSWSCVWLQILLKAFELGVHVTVYGYYEGYASGRCRYLSTRVWTRFDATGDPPIKGITIQWEKKK